MRDFGRDQGVRKILPQAPRRKCPWGAYSWYSEDKILSATQISGKSTIYGWALDRKISVWQRLSRCHWFRVREKITSQSWRSDLVQVCLIRDSKTTGIASYFEAFESEVSAKDGLKLRCENVKLFLREPLASRFVLEKEFPGPLLFLGYLLPGPIGSTVLWKILCKSATNPSDLPAAIME